MLSRGGEPRRGSLEPRSARRGRLERLPAVRSTSLSIHPAGEAAAAASCSAGGSNLAMQRQHLTMNGIMSRLKAAQPAIAQRRVVMVCASPFIEVRGKYPVFVNPETGAKLLRYNPTEESLTRQLSAAPSPTGRGKGPYGEASGGGLSEYSVEF